MESLQGVYNILSTPFDADGKLDEVSLKRLVHATVGMGVTGITILGVAGETQKLSDEERHRLSEIVFQTVAGAVPVIVGTSRDGTDVTIAASLEAQRMGAAGVMIAPPTFLQAGPALTGHFRSIGNVLSVPIVLQDYPVVNGVSLSPRAMADLVLAVPEITTIKLEDVPTPLRIAQTLALLEGRATIVGGLGGMYLLDELRRGGSGTMTGFAYPEILIEIWDAWSAGNHSKAADIFYRYLPLLVFEGQPRLGVAIRKEILRQRGLIAISDLRQPGPKVDADIVLDLEATLLQTGVRDIYDHVRS